MKQPETPGDARAPITELVMPLRLEYEVIPGQARARMLAALTRGELVGQRCPRCKKVYIAMYGACNVCSVPLLDQDVLLADTGTVTSYCIVHIPFEGMWVEVPYISAWIQVDGADVPLLHLVQNIALDRMKVGLRVRAHWAPPDQRVANLETIRYFEPLDPEQCERRPAGSEGPASSEIGRRP